MPWLLSRRNSCRLASPPSDSGTDDSWLLARPNCCRLASPPSDSGTLARLLKRLERAFDPPSAPRLMLEKHGVTRAGKPCGKGVRLGGSGAILK